MTNRALIALGLLGLSGCGLPLADRGDVVSNTCDSDAACGPGGMCTGDGICVSTTGELPGLLVQVDIPSTARYGAGTSSLIAVESPLAAQSDGAVARDFVMPPLREITKSISVQESAHPRLVGCGDALQVKEGNSIPIAVEILPKAVAAGIPMTVYSEESDPDPESLTNAVTVLVPEADYRVYVRPLSPPVDDCDVPPALFTSIQSDTVMLDQPASLRGTIITGGLNLEDWTLDLVDKDTGRAISTLQTFPPGDSYFELLFWSELVNVQSLDPIIRLTPSESARAQGMPVVFWYLKSVALLGFDNVELDVQQLATALPVNVNGAIYDSQGGEAAPATVVLQSISILDGTFGENISYKTSVQTNSDGVFPDPGIHLLPGQYQVTALPGSADLAITRGTWEVNSTYSQSVYTFEVKPKTALIGRVFTPQAEDAYAMQVFVQPTALPPQNFAQSQFNNAELQPTNDTTQTVGDGSFELGVDPGAYDFFVRPPEDSNLPWLVTANLDIKPWAEDHVFDDLKELHLANPVVLRGAVKAPDGSNIGGATIRAWVPWCLDGYELVVAEMVCRPTADNEETADVIPTAIQVGETTADGNGAYRLLLPPSFSQ